MIASGIYKGWVSHHRYEHSTHHFRYKVAMLLLHLDTLQETVSSLWGLSHNRFNLMSIRDVDYQIERGQNLKSMITQLIASRFNKTCHADIYLLTHPAYLGYVFNPISLFMVISPEKKELLYLIACVHNTPWLEQHWYVLQPERKSINLYCATATKAMHVSPFMPMNYQYVMQLAYPDDKLKFTIDNKKNDEITFKAMLNLQREPLTNKSLLKMFFTYPLQTHHITARIYWQALKLFCKKVPFIPHPKKVNR